MKRKRDDAKTTATLYLEVDYECIPETSEIAALVDRAREYGYPRVAKLSILRATEVDYT